jgi:hypothetical protein
LPERRQPLGEDHGRRRIVLLNVNSDDFRKIHLFPQLQSLFACATECAGDSSWAPTPSIVGANAK